MKKGIKIFASSLVLGLLINSASASEQLAKAKGCMGCHQIGAKVVGPSYKDVAKKYTSKDIEKLVNKVLKGGSGVWGKVPMPPNQISKEEAKKLVSWILTLKK